MDSRPSLFILDAYSRIYQVFHAIRDGMTGPAGQPTHAVFGLFRDLLNLTNPPRADYLLVATEGGESAHRTEVFAEYKANRKAMPDDLKAQMPTIKRLFEAFGLPVLMEMGHEADDVIATVARKAEAFGMDVTIMTADKDARQLLSPHVRILNLRDNKILDEAALAADWGVSPAQVVDYLALTGDAVDNVPGVPTIGGGYAKKLLQAFGTLEEAIARIDEVGKAIGPARQAKLRDHQDDARRAQSLVVLRDDLPLTLDWDALRYRGYDAKELKAICIESGFHRFLGEIIDDAPPPEAAWDRGAYKTIDTSEALAAFVGDLERQTKVSFDTETTSVDPLSADIVGYSFSWNEGDAYYLPVRGPMFDRVLDPDATLAALAPALTNPAIEKVGQNLKYDMLVLQRVGVELSGPITDTMVLSYLLESGERNHNLDDMSRRLLDHTMIPISDLIGKGKNQKTMDEIEVAKVTEYAGEDADAAWRLESMLAPKCREEGLWELYTKLERPLIRVLAAMETVGIKVDVGRLRALSAEFATRIEGLKGEIHAAAGREFNIGSGPQLRQLLFDQLGLPILKKTPKGEPSTDVEVLEELALKHPLPRKIIEFRQLEKLKSTYLDTLANLAREDGRVHTSFNQVVAATGRLSSSDPNLQNIPARTEEGRQIRQAFVAGFPGWKLLTADYSQIELRILAHYSRDPELVAAFAEDRDIHSAVASGIFGVTELEVTKDQRRMAKTVNFGVIYGLSAFGLASRLGITQHDAAEFIESYFRKYAGVDRFINHTREVAMATGRVETILGRRRAISGIKNTFGRNLNLAERTAINTVIQGSAADMIKRAMLAVDRRLRESGMSARMLLQIHDELVFEAPEAEVSSLAMLVREEMISALDLSVPIGVDVSVGPNWLDVEPIA